VTSFQEFEPPLPIVKRAAYAEAGGGDRGMDESVPGSRSVFLVAGRAVDRYNCRYAGILALTSAATHTTVIGFTNRGSHFR
jgi:hypothetical protein